MFTATFFIYLFLTLIAVTLVAIVLSKSPAAYYKWKIRKLSLRLKRKDFNDPVTYNELMKYQRKLQIHWFGYDERENMVQRAFELSCKAADAYHAIDTRIDYEYYIQCVLEEDEAIFRLKLYDIECGLRGPMSSLEKADHKDLEMKMNLSMNCWLEDNQ